MKIMHLSFISQKFGSFYFGNQGNYSCNLGKVTCKGSQNDNSKQYYFRFTGYSNPFTIHFRSLSFSRIQVLVTCTQGSEIFRNLRSFCMVHTDLEKSLKKHCVLEKSLKIEKLWDILEVLEFSIKVLEYF